MTLKWTLLFKRLQSGSTCWKPCTWSAELGRKSAVRRSKPVRPNRDCCCLRRTYRSARCQPRTDSSSTACWTDWRKIWEVIVCRWWRCCGSRDGRKRQIKRTHSWDFHSEENEAVAENDSDDADEIIPEPPTPAEMRQCSVGMRSWKYWVSKLLRRLSLSSKKSTPNYRLNVHRSSQP